MGGSLWRVRVLLCCAQAASVLQRQRPTKDVNKHCEMPMEEFNFTCTNHEHGCALKHIENNCVKQILMYAMVYDKLTERRLATPPGASGLLSCDCVHDIARMHVPH